MRTLLISDLHLGTRMRRDVLRRDVALDRLCDALGSVDRLVLLGDTVEMLEGRPRQAMEAAEPVLRRIGNTLGRGKDVLLLAGNHDHELVRPWLETRREGGRPVGLSTRVPLNSNPDLQAISRWMKPARVEVRYPGVDLGDGVWAHHGHYLDRHLIRRAEVGTDATAEEYEDALGTSIAALGAGVGASLPKMVSDQLDRADGFLRRAAQAATITRPIVASLPGAGLLAPANSAALGLQFRRVGLPAMSTVASALGVDATDVVFGHLHRAGPLDGDDRDEWRPGEPRLWNTGCWVYEPLLVGGASPPRLYWPGRAIVVDGSEITSIGLLDDLDPNELR
ncbi:MAG: metallophosphoesterase [Herbiconiux sp.]|nr:metallophosphoesterase [Herbiconiux sp.]